MQRDEGKMALVPTMLFDPNCRYLLGWHATNAGGSVAGVAPWVGPGMAEISAQGAF
jgi:hypothetical protein